MQERKARKRIKGREIMITVKRASKCVTHHYACDCREWKYEKMESALQVIHTWAFCYLEEMDTLNAQHIIRLCEKALKEPSNG